MNSGGGTEIREAIDARLEQYAFVRDLGRGCLFWLYFVAA